LRHLQRLAGIKRFSYTFFLHPTLVFRYEVVL
jgi:hypothetical protein